MLYDPTTEHSQTTNLRAGEHISGAGKGWRRKGVGAAQRAVLGGGLFVGMTQSGDLLVGLQEPPFGKVTQNYAHAFHQHQFPHFHSVP